MPIVIIIIASGVIAWISVCGAALAISRMAAVADTELEAAADAASGPDHGHHLILVAGLTSPDARAREESFESGS
jgi:hypothetical protein